MQRWLTGLLLALTLIGCGGPRPAATPAPPLDGLRIVVDPGHGGRNPGAQGVNGVRETDITLDIAARLAERLRAEGAEVTLTRTTDVSMGLGARAEVANRRRADLFISLHANWSPDERLHGTSVYICHTCGNQAASRRLSDAIQGALTTSLGLRDIGVLHENFKVLRRADMPAVLVETAFLSNPQEAAMLADPAFREKTAQAVAAGVSRFAANLLSAHPASALPQPD